MKKRALSALLLAAPLTLACACGGGTPKLALSANWLSNTTNDTVLGTRERLEYAVSFTPAENDGYSVSYETETATLVTELEGIQYEDYTGVYHLTTTRTIAGKYRLGATESERFEDSTRSEVWFLGVSDQLRPLKSVTEVHSTSPITNPTASRLFHKYDFTYSVEYDEALTNAHVVMQTFDEEGTETDKTEKDVELEGDGSFLDNEQIAFALRGVSFGSSVRFRTIDPQTFQCVTVGTGATPTEAVTHLEFENEDGLVQEEVRTVEVVLSYGTVQSGPTRTLTYAAKGDANGNTYRNVLVSFENPISFSLGTLTYKLKKASFDHTV